MKQFPIFNFKFSNHKAGGFTIIETMIAISVFIVVVMAGMGALLNANLIHQKSQDMRSILDSLSFVMEDMSRNLRTGYNYRCYPDGATTLPSTDPLSTPRSCANGWGVVFEATGGNPALDTDQWAYYLDTTGKIYKNINGADGSKWIDLVPSEVILSQSSGFLVLGAEPPTTGNNKQQPLVIIKLVGSIDYKGTITPFSIQTSVSQRNIDI